MRPTVDKAYDIVVIGGGPGGYVAAIRAAQLGLSVMVVEKEALGGVCLNWGCIPSKNLIQQPEEFHTLTAMEKLGVKVDRSGMDYSKVQENSRAAAKTLSDGVSGLLRNNGVRVIKGTGRLAGVGKVAVTGADGAVTKVDAKNVIIATGSRPIEAEGFEFDETRVLSSTVILAMSIVPKSMVILGGGAIGCEFAFIMNAFGVEVSLVEMAEHLLPTEDHECTDLLAKSFVARGINVLTSARAKSLAKGANTVTVVLETPQGAKIIETDSALAVFGRKPNTENIGLETVGVKADSRGFIVVGDYNQTSVKGVLAIGDVTAAPMLAHVASREGEHAVEFIAGHPPRTKNVNAEDVPSRIYCEPQVAGFGLRDDEARAKGIAIKKSVPLSRHRQGRCHGSRRRSGQTHRRSADVRHSRRPCGGTECHGNHP